MIELPQTENELNELIELANKKKVEIAANAVTEFNALVSQVKEMASELGISQRELAQRFKVVKYVHPDSGKTWSGVGKAPSWFDKAVSVE